LRVLEHQLGKGAEEAELQQTLDPRDMTPAQRQAAIGEMLEKHPGLAALIPRAPAA
jgi:hypothetical protein